MSKQTKPNVYLLDEGEFLDGLDPVYKDITDEFHLVEALLTFSEKVSSERRLEMYGDTLSQQTLYRAFVWFVKEVGDNAEWCDGAYSNDDAESIVSMIYGEVLSKGVHTQPEADEDAEAATRWQ